VYRLVGGWKRSNGFEYSVGEWSEFGLSHPAVSRGLDELDRAGLISTVRGQGKSPVVTILKPD
jgi:DNA-binding transcriptional ArsR family regulator